MKRTKHINKSPDLTHPIEHDEIRQAVKPNPPRRCLMSRTTPSSKCPWALTTPSPESPAARMGVRETKRRTMESMNWSLGALGAAGRLSLHCSWRSAFLRACAAFPASGYVQTAQLPERIGCC